MKILGKRTDKWMLKWILYVTAAYLLASWGVNKVADPMHYIRNMRMTKEYLQMEKGARGYELRFPDHMRQKRYLSFYVTDSEDYFFSMELYGCLADGRMEAMKLQVCRGWNCIDLEDRQWTGIRIPQDAVELQGLRLESAMLTAYQKADVGRMVYAAGSLLLLAVFWECMWWVKKKYAQ